MPTRKNNIIIHFLRKVGRKAQKSHQVESFPSMESWFTDNNVLGNCIKFSAKFKRVGRKIISYKEFST